MSSGYGFSLTAGFDVAKLAGLPGVRVRGQRVYASVTARSLVERHGLKLATIPQESPGLPKSAKQALVSLREWVPAFLTDYQRRGVAAVLAMPGGSGHLWWSAGSGKTLGAIVWALASPGRTVVVTKAAVRGQWRAEVERFTTERVTLVEGEKASELGVDDRFVVISYEILPAWIAALEAWGRGLQIPISVVFDESHKVKSHKRWDATPDGDDKVKFNLKENVAAAAHRLSKLAGRRLATTATPVRDRPRDLWAQLDLVHPGAWGGYWDFAKRYCGARENAWGGWDDTGKSNVDELKERLALVAHRVKHSEANRSLPAKRRVVTYVRPEEQVRAVGIAEEIKAAAKHGATAMLEVRLAEAAARKRKRLVDRVEEALDGGEKVIVFTGRRRDCDDLGEALAKLGVKIWVGHGGHGTAERDTMRQEYMAHPGPCVLVGTTDAWGEGLNLQDTDLLVVAMLPYTPGAVVQLEGRVARLGQKRPVLIEYMVAEGTVDEHVAGILLGKLPAVEKVIESEEVAGFSAELSGANDPKVMETLALKILGGGA